MLDINKAVKDKIEKMEYDPNEVEEWKPLGDENDLKLEAIPFLFRSLPKFAAALKDKDAILLKTDPKNPFWISDNPVTMHNDNNMRPYGNIGLSVPGIQIYLPLSPTFTLALWCPAVANQIREALSVQRTMERNVDRAELSKGITEIERILEKNELTLAALEKGTASLCDGENVKFLNSLQVKRSSRFIISQTDSFDLAEEMIRDNPKYRGGSGIKTD